MSIQNGTILGCLCLIALCGDRALAQTWLPMGPAPVSEVKVDGNVVAETNVSGITQGSYSNPAAGAMSAILPVTETEMYAGAVNGGVWKTTDGAKTWTPIGDRLPSLSITTMTFDAAHPQQLWVGFGHRSAMLDMGGYLGGVAFYDTRSQSWSAPAGNARLVGQNITQLTVSGRHIFVAVKGVDKETGIWASDNGGTTFNRVAQGVGLANGDVTSLVQYTGGGVTTLYAGVIGKLAGETGIYASTDNGATWQKVPDIAPNPDGSTTTRIMLTVANDGTVVTSLLTPKDSTSIVEVYRIRPTAGGFATTALGNPVFTAPNGTQVALYNGGQFYPHASLLVDPKNPNIVYIGGDLVPNPLPDAIGARTYNGNLFRGEYNPATGKTTWTPLTNDYAANNSGPHADSRFLFLDTNGNLLETDDGGIYRRTNPTSSSGAWESLNGNLQTSEMHTARWNSLTHTVLGATQDNGTSFQPAAGSPAHYAVNGGDGTLAAVNANWVVNGQRGAALYSSYIALEGFARGRVEASGAYVASTEILVKDGDIVLNKDAKTAANYFPFTPAFALNSNDPSRFAVGGYRLYVGQDALQMDSRVEIQVTARSDPTKYGFITLAYGAADQSYALLAGTGDNKTLSNPGALYYSSNALTTDAKLIYDSPNKGIQSAVFDRQYGSTQIYLTDSSKVWRLSNATDGTIGTPTDISGDPSTTGLPAAFNEKRALAQVYNNGVSALVVAGAHRPAAETTVTVDNFLYALSAPASATTYDWSTRLGSLPNAQVFGLDYSVADDVLLANLLGRGAFVLYDVTTFFPEATRLVFGQAQNNSTPTTAQLSDGTSLAGTSFSRSLIKNGSGTLDLSGKTAGYSGDTYLNGGTVVVSATANLGTSSNALQFDGGTLKYGTASFVLTRDLALGANGGTLNLNGLPRQQTFNIAGAGQFSVTGGGALTLDRTNTQGGGTAVIGGSTVVAASNDQLGADRASITLDDGSLYLVNGFGATEGYAFNRPITIGLDSGLIFTDGRSFSYTGGLIGSAASGKYAGALYFVGPVFSMGADLELNAFWHGDLTVPNGMTLTGVAGPTGTLTVNGTYAPGKSPGTAEFPGSVVQNPGSDLDIEIDGTGTDAGRGNYDRIVLSGPQSVFVAGGRLDPVLRGMSEPANNDYTPVLGQGFEIIRAPGGVLGSFAGMTQPAAGLAPGTRLDAVYGATTLSLYATPAAYGRLSAAGVNDNSNRQSLGQALDAIRPVAGVRPADGGVKAVFDGLAPQSSATLPVSMDQLGGVGYAQVLGMNFENSKFLSDQTMLAVATQRRGERRPLRDERGEPSPSDPDEAMWGQAIGRLSTWRGDDLAYAMNDALGGLIGGIQKRIDAGTLAGLSLAYAGSNPSITENMGGGAMQNLQLMGYAARWFDDGTYLQGTLGVGGGQINADRPVTMLGTGYSSVIRTGNLAASALLGWSVGTRDTLRTEVGLGANYLGMRNSGFTDEGGRGAAALSASSGTNTSMTCSVGAAASVPFRAQEIDWRASAFATVAHEFADTRLTLDAQVLGQSYQVQSGAIGRNRLNLGLGLSGYVARQTSVALDLSNQSATHWNATAANISIKLGF